MVDAVVTVRVVEHQALEVPICMLHGDTRKGKFPSDVKESVQYGENLQALSVALNTVGAVSIKRTLEILSGVFNIPIATGTISNMVKRCADVLSNTVEKSNTKCRLLLLDILMKPEPELIKNYGEFMMPQTVNTPIWISVQSVVSKVWSSAVFS